MTMKLYHVSETAEIEVFLPRPSPSRIETIKGNVVFAINEIMLHNYLLPRNCPRVSYYATSRTTEPDKNKFVGNTKCKFIVAVGENWVQEINAATLYLYELPADNFTLLDEGAGYCVSYDEVRPLSVSVITDTFRELEKRDAEIRITKDLQALADEISVSSLQFSIIRMRNL